VPLVEFTYLNIIFINIIMDQVILLHLPTSNVEYVDNEILKKVKFPCT